MTREEAIAVLKGYIENPLVNDTKAFDMAIQALSQEPTDKPMTVDEMEREYEKSKALFHKIVECDDAISRQAVLDLINADWKYEGLEEPVSSLPPVTQKSGKWIPNYYFYGIYDYTCSECKKHSKEQSEFCPKCGARMVEPQESEG